MESPPFLFTQALQDHRQNRLDVACEKLQQVILTHPQFEDAYEALAVILYELKKFNEAIEVIQQWVRLNPDSIMAQTNLSRCYVAKEMIAEAEKAQAEARRLGWKAELKAKKQEMKKADPNELIERYKQVIELDPADVLGYFSLGTAYLDNQCFKEAVETLRKAIEVDPKHSSSYYQYGQALEGLQDIETAKKIYQQGIAVANEKGDMMTQKKMEARLRALQ